MRAVLGSDPLPFATVPSDIPSGTTTSPCAGLARFPLDGQEPARAEKRATRSDRLQRIFENNWVAARTGYALLFKLQVDQDGRAPWSDASDITLQYNIVSATYRPRSTFWNRLRAPQRAYALASKFAMTSFMTWTRAAGRATVDFSWLAVAARAYRHRSRHRDFKAAALSQVYGTPNGKPWVIDDTAVHQRSDPTHQFGVIGESPPGLAGRRGRLCDHDSSAATSSRPGSISRRYPPIICSQRRRADGAVHGQCHDDYRLRTTSGFRIAGTDGSMLARIWKSSDARSCPSANRDQPPHARNRVSPHEYVSAPNACVSG